MFRNRATVVALLSLLLAPPGMNVVPSGASAQEPYSPLVPRGSVRLGVLGEYSSFSELYRIGGRAGGPHGLGDLFNGEVGSGIFPFLATSEAAVREAIDDDYALSLGTMASVLEKSSARVPLALDVGVFEWLTVGAVVPFVQNETEFTTSFAADSSAVNAGFSPGIEDPAVVSGFLSGLQGSIGGYDQFRARTCATDPMSDACRDATALVAQARVFQRQLTLMYGGMFVPVDWSDAGAALQARLAEFAEAFAAAGVPAVPGAVPLASVLLTTEDLELLATDPFFGVEATHPLDKWRSLWRIGDIEVRADARVYETGDPEGPGRLTVGAGAMVRLPTGTQDDPGNFLDSGSGDAQLDVEARAWMNGRWGERFGLWADVRYGVQLPGSTVRRVFDPGRAFAPRSSEVTLDWNPGDYQFVELSPWYRIGEPLTLTAGYRFFRKGEDAFTVPVAVVDEGVAAASANMGDPAVLVPGSGGSVGQALLGMVYNRGVRAGEDGPVGDPLEIRVIYRRAVGGSGGLPVARSLEVGFRFFVGVWGGE